MIVVVIVFVVVILLAGRSSPFLPRRNIEKAARSIGIGHATLLRWLREPEFDTAYREVRRAVAGLRPDWYRKIRTQRGPQRTWLPILPNNARENLGKGKHLSLKALADVSGVSESRLMHVFTESVGVPIRPYILWLRLQRACYELMNGATATEPAQVAGFSDTAHQTRTFRRMLGTTPTELLNRRTMTQGLSL